jgi:hypothetical protein
MSARTYDDGVWVGKGPSVSVGATVQLLELVPPVVVVLPVVLVGVTESSLPHASSKTEADAKTANRLLRKCFLSMTLGSK